MKEFTLEDGRLCLIAGKVIPSWEGSSCGRRSLDLLLPLLLTTAMARRHYPKIAPRHTIENIRILPQKKILLHKTSSHCASKRYIQVVSNYQILPNAIRKNDNNYHQLKT